MPGLRWHDLGNYAHRRAGETGRWRTSIEQSRAASKQARVAIVSGRRIEEVKRLLENRFRNSVLGSSRSRIHGRKRRGEFRFGCSGVCARSWRASGNGSWAMCRNPAASGLRTKSRQSGSLYRQAVASEAAELPEKFSEFVSVNALRLKLVQLKMIDEAMPRCASKARAVKLLKARKPRAFATIYCGDDSTDEDAFAALGDDDVSVLIGAPRVTRAAYRLPDPAALAVELSQLADALTRADGRA